MHRSWPRTTVIPPGGTGFTLIELLVVILIISLLIGILLPALGDSRRLARVVACGANMKQIGTAVFAYAADNDDELPRGPAVTHGYFGAPFTYEGTADSQVWIGGSQYASHGVVLETHLRDKRALFCPADDTTDPADELLKIGGPQDAYGSYIYRNLDQTSGSPKLSSLGENENGEPVKVLAFDRQTLITAIPNAFRTNHANQASNLLFVEGHVQQFDNGQGENLFVLRAGDEAIFPIRLDQMLMNGDHAGAGGAGPYPFP